MTERMAEKRKLATYLQKKVFYIKYLNRPTDAMESGTAPFVIYLVLLGKKIKYHHYGVIGILILFDEHQIVSYL